MLEMADYIFDSKSTYNKVLLEEKLQLAEKVKDYNLKYDTQLKSPKRKCH